MLNELVDSRLTIPPLPPQHVTRPRLLARLDQARDVPLILISAGPGCGKTVLLADWARRSRAQVAWLCPAPDDATPTRFRSLLHRALRVPAEDITHPVPSQTRVIDFVHSLLGQLPAGRAPLILVVDDAHVLADQQIANILDKLVLSGHPRLHVVLSARSDPALPLHRYRLAGAVQELRAADLAMTRQETQDLLTAHQVLLPVSALNVLAARTEGWAAGVRLAAMRMARSTSPAGQAYELSFDYGSIGEYLIAEVLTQQPEPLRRVLIETSFLDEVTAPLAEAVTGLAGTAEMLADLVRANLFVVALDPAGTRFRYHRLLAEVLRHLLAQEKSGQLPELEGRAAAYFEREGDLERALYWAARAGDQCRAAAVLVRGGLSRAFAHHRAIPAADLAPVLSPAPADGTAGHHPEIALAAAALRACEADAATAAEELEQSRSAPRPGQQADETTRQTAELVELILGMRSGEVRAVDEAASRLIREPLGGELRGAVLLAQASAHFWEGSHDDVDVLLSQALAEAEQSGLPGVMADVLGMIACVDAYRGRSRNVEEAKSRTCSLLRGKPGLRMPLALRLAAVIRSCQRADPAAAARAMSHTSAQAAVSADPGLAAALTLWHGTILALSGQPNEAQAVLNATDRSYPRLLEVHRDIVLGGIDISLGRPQAALKRLLPHREGRLATLAYVPCAHAHLAMNELESAYQCVRGVLSVKTTHISRYALLEAMLLDARIGIRKGDAGRALEMITNALDVGHGDLVLPFVQAERDFAGLLARHPAVARRWPTAPVSADGRLAPAGGQPSDRHLPVRLTQREQSVLAYLATNMTSTEIAAEMYLSVNTVKTHLAAIYRKLGAARRRDAVRRARELELLLPSRDLDPRVFANQVHESVDERQVRERLREVPQLPPGSRVDLRGVQQQRAGERQQLLAQRPRAGYLADLGERRLLKRPGGW